MRTPQPGDIVVFADDISTWLFKGRQSPWNYYTFEHTPPRVAGLAFIRQYRTLQLALEEGMTVVHKKSFDESDPNVAFRNKYNERKTEQ